VKVLLINQYFPPDASGSAYILGELAEDLAQNNSVHVIAGRPSYSSAASAFEPQGVRLTTAASTTFGRGNLAGRVINYASFIASAALRTVRAPRPDVVVTMTDPPFAGLLGVIGALWHRRPFVLLCHDVYPDIAIALGVLRPGPLPRIWRGLNKVIRGVASRIVVVGRDMGDKLAADGVPRSKLEFIPTWAPDDLPGADERAAIRAAEQWEDRFIVMHAGN